MVVKIAGKSGTLIKIHIGLLILEQNGSIKGQWQQIPKTQKQHYRAK